MLSLLPYVGPMWYHRVAVEHMLHHGIACWGDVHWQLQGSGRLPCNTLAEPLRTIEHAWGDRYLAKLSINSVVGLWASTKTHSFSVLTSSHPADCPQSLLTRHFSYGDASVIDYISATPLIDNATMRPIHDLRMHTEATRMAQLLFIMTRLGCPPRSVENVKTDK